MSELSEILKKIEHTKKASMEHLTISRSTIANHYDKSSKAFKYLHSFEGSVHMAISDDSLFRSIDFRVQAKKIEQLINKILSQKNTSLKVLELGCGKGFNLIYLAKAFPQISFIGIDITPSHLEIAKKKTKHMANVEILEMDFDGLSFELKSFDLIFEIESICYSKDHRALGQNIYDLLKKNGLYVLFELFRNGRTKKTTTEEKKFVSVLEKSMGIYIGIEFDEWQDIMRRIGFKALSCINHSTKILPNLKRFKKMASLYFFVSFYFPWVNFLFSKTSLRNAISGYMIHTSVSKSYHIYQEIILKK